MGKHLQKNRRLYRKKQKLVKKSKQYALKKEQSHEPVLKEKKKGTHIFPKLSDLVVDTSKTSENTSLQSGPTADSISVASDNTSTQTPLQNVEGHSNVESIQEESVLDKLHRDPLYLQFQEYKRVKKRLGKQCYRDFGVLH